ncbi:MAG: hypothetical protein MUF62_14105 [Chitinophagaceae bacterium]|jgi:uncharacterized membrane protein|nr:hypothetical protein [Chitinophagaceae bacterium]
MRNKLITWSLLTVALLWQAAASAQAGMDNQPATMADAMRSNGKIYVVVAVLSTILVGLVAYMVRLDRKIGRLEKNGEA